MDFIVVRNEENVYYFNVEYITLINIDKENCAINIRTVDSGDIKIEYKNISLLSSEANHILYSIKRLAAPQWGE